MKRFTKMMTAGFGALALFLSATAQAQTTKVSTWSLGIGLEAGIPTGNASDISNFEIGGTARLEYGVSKSVALMFTTGYYNMVGKTAANGLKYPSLGMVPLKIGIKGYVAPSFYIDGEVGAGFDTNYENHTKLLFSPGIGYDLKPLDISLRYENYSGQNNSFGLLGLRVAYVFGM